MKGNKVTNNFDLQVFPVYNEKIVVGLRFLLNGFIIKDAKMMYRVYTILLELMEEAGPPLPKLDENLKIGDTISLPVDIDDIQNLIISFKYEFEMVGFCEEWKTKNFKMTYWNESPDFTHFGIN